MPPTQQYPKGYWVIEKKMDNGGWQKLDPSTMKPGPQQNTHVPQPSVPMTPRMAVPEGPFMVIPLPDPLLRQIVTPCTTECRA
jgi:hypothetical protein